MAAEWADGLVRTPKVVLARDGEDAALAIASHEALRRDRHRALNTSQAGGASALTRRAGTGVGGGASDCALLQQLQPATEGGAVCRSLSWECMSMCHSSVECDAGARAGR